MLLGLTGRHYAVPEEISHGRQESCVPGISERIVSLVRSRGVSEQELDHFFNPTIKRLMPNPSSLQDMDGGANVIAQAILNGVKIGMVGDYDVDGATSVAIMQNFILDTGHPSELVEFYIPQRLEEGYGVSIASVDTLYANGARVLLVLDSGTGAHTVIAHARALGMSAVIVDHHKVDKPWNKPDAFVINPCRYDDTSGVPYLCTAGLAILLCVRVSALLNAAGRTGLPNIMDYMGLAALGTVADLMSLNKGFNRALVRAGLSRMHVLTGLAGLVLGVKGKTLEDNFPILSASDLGFSIGPAVNAAGRISDCRLGSTVLTSDNMQEAIDVGRKLYDLNIERRKIQSAIEPEAMAIKMRLRPETGALESAPKEATDCDNSENGFDSVAFEAKLDSICGQTQPDDKFIVVYNEDWHPGVIGIVAARIKETFNLPSVVIGAGGKGSGRSAHGFDLGSAFIGARQAGILVAGGGHAAAGGLTILPERIDDFRAFLREKTRDLVKQPDRLDGVLPIDDVTMSLVREQEAMEPFGSIGNPYPVWLIPNVTITRARWVGKEATHLSVEFEGGRSRFSGIIFSAKGKPLARLYSMMGEQVSLAVEISRSSYTGPGGSDINIIIRDAFVGSVTL